MARVVAMRGCDVEHHPALDPDQRDDVGGGGDHTTDSEHAALEPREPHVLAIGHLGEPLRRVPRACDADPILGLWTEPLRRRQRDVLRRAFGLCQEAVPQRPRRSLEMLDVLATGNRAHAATLVWARPPGGTNKPWPPTRGPHFDTAS